MPKLRKNGRHLFEEGNGWRSGCYCQEETSGSALHGSGAKEVKLSIFEK